jgi:hypothetical protein
MQLALVADALPFGIDYPIWRAASDAARVHHQDPAELRLN